MYCSKDSHHVFYIGFSSWGKYNRRAAIIEYLCVGRTLTEIIKIHVERILHISIPTEKYEEGSCKLTYKEENNQNLLTSNNSKAYFKIYGHYETLDGFRKAVCFPERLDSSPET